MSEKVETRTNTFRWLKRWKGTDGERVLQQLWIYDRIDAAGRVLSSGEMWRDVPVVDDKRDAP